MKQKQKKTMRLWQMILIMILSVAMLATMFLPAFRINGDAVSEATEKIVGSTLTSLIGSDMESMANNIDESVQSYEQEYGVKISKISAFQIMTKSITKLIGGDAATAEDEQEMQTEEMLSSIQKKYTLLRVMLWIVYGLALIVLIMTLLGFLLKMSKFIPLIISTLYGLIASIVFGYLRFLLLRKVGKNLGEGMASLIIGEVPEGVDLSVVTDAMPKVMSAFYSFAFLAAFIIAILILIISVVSMLVGNSTEDEKEYDDGEELSGNIGNGQMQQGNNFSNEQHYFGGGDSGYNGVTEPVKQEPPKQKKAVQPPMGRVRCTMGDAAGQGYALPQDRKVIVGKSQQNANLVINNQHISNVHCSIRYDAATNMYLVKDHSMNGTFVNGSRLQKDVTQQFPAGTVLSLADGSNQITLG